jgi:hypothetical protein
MTLQKCFLLLSILLTLAGSFYLVQGNFLSATDIVKQSGTVYGGNLALRIGFISIRIYSTVGFALLFVGIIMQIISMSVGDSRLDIGIVIGASFVVMCLIILFANLYIHYQRIGLIRETSKMEIMKYPMPDGATIKDRIDKKYGGHYLEIGKNFFLIEKGEAENDDDYTKRLCGEIEKINIH